MKIYEKGTIMMAHFYKIRGGYTNKTDEDIISIHLNVGAKVFSLIGRIEVIFVDKRDDSGVLQYCFFRYDNYSIVVRHQDSFTVPVPVRPYMRNEIHFFSQDEYTQWQQIGSFIEVNPLQQIKYGEQIAFQYPPLTDGTTLNAGKELLAQIINCAINNKPFKAREDEWPLQKLMQLLDSYKPLGELAFVAYGVREKNFKREANIYISNEVLHGGINNTAIDLIESVVEQLAAGLNEIDISRVVAHEEYNRRLNRLLQYEYCIRSLRYIKDQPSACTDAQKEQLFTFCAKLLTDTNVPGTLKDEDLQVLLIQSMNEYCNTHPQLRKAVLSFDRDLLQQHLPVDKLVALMLNDNSLEKAYSEEGYLFVQSFNAPQFEKAVIKIAHNADLMDGPVRDKIFEAALHTGDYELLNKMDNLAQQQIDRAFKQIPDEQFVPLAPFFDKADGILLYADAANGEENKGNYLKARIIESKSFPFEKLYAYYNNRHWLFGNLLFEKKTHDIVFKNRELKEYKAAFKKAGEEDLLYAKLSEAGLLNRKDKLQNEVRLLAKIKTAYPQAKGILNKYKIAFVGLLVLFAGSLLWGYFLHRENVQMQVRYNALTESGRQYFTALDSLDAGFTEDTLKLRNIVNAVSVVNGTITTNKDIVRIKMDSADLVRLDNDFYAKYLNEAAILRTMALALDSTGAAGKKTVLLDTAKNDIAKKIQDKYVGNGTSFSGANAVVVHILTKGLNNIETDLIKKKLETEQMKEKEKLATRLKEVFK